MSHNSSPLAQQMKARDREMVPRILVMAMFGLMAATLALVTFARLTDQPLRGVPEASAVVQSKEIILDGTRSDGVAVRDIQGSQLAHSSDKRAGFIGVIWTTMSRARKLKGVAGNPPIELQRLENGHTALFDPASGWSIELIGYGSDNVAAFAKLHD